MDMIRQNWQEILNNIKVKHNLSDLSVRTWLLPLSIYKIEDFVITIRVQKMALDIIVNKYYDLLKEEITDFTGKEYEIKFIASENDDDISKNEESHFEKNPASLGLNPKYTFDTFVVGSNNKFAHAASLAVAEAPGKVYNPLFLYGGVGLGKTHLMHSIAHFINQNHPRMNILYVTSEQFTNEVIDAIRNGNSSAISRFREKYRNIDILLVDDIQFIIGKESTQEEFFHTFNSLHSAGKQIVISSDRPPKNMNILEERIRSRFEWGLMADIQSPDFETRIAILQKKQETDGFTVGQNIIEYIAENVKSNIRELEGSLNKIIAMSISDNKEADLELAKEALKDIITPEEKKNLSPDLIISEVASFFNISVEDIKGDRRSNKIAYPRQLAMYLIREMTNTNLQSIGDLMGGKDHTTIMYGVKKIENSILENPSVEEEIENIKRQIFGE